MRQFRRCIRYVFVYDVRGSVSGLPLKSSENNLGTRDSEADETEIGTRDS